MNVVVDTNVVVSAIFWTGESRDYLVLRAKRQAAREQFPRDSPVDLALKRA
jgi:predicted nucleic acid-binding protein